MIQTIRYSNDHKAQWDEFVHKSKNGTFLFLRDYMDYHADRFRDHSLMFLQEENVVAMLPASEREDGALVSHGGLTYGGLIMGQECTGLTVCHIFEALLSYMQQAGIKQCIYKAIPYIYHRYPAQEDLYALTKVCHAALIDRKISEVLDFSHPLPIRERRQRYIRAARRKGIEITESQDMAAFWPILCETLQRKYGANPVHTLQEMQMLHDRFPDNIHLLLAEKEGNALSGAVLYVTDTCVHAQYLCSSVEGDVWRCNEVMTDHIFSHYAHLRYFDYGTSADEGPYDVNETLLSSKEGYGCRAVMYDTYCISLP